MRAGKMASQAGFTIIELITVMTIISILAGISVQSFAVYREDALYSVSEQALRSAITALDAGRDSGEESFPSQILWTYSYTSGRVTYGDAALIAPGLNNNSRSYIYVFHNPTCTTTWCLADFVTSRHCNSEQYTYWYRYGGGFDGTVEHVDATGWSC